MAVGGTETVIPRYQTILFIILLAASAAMGTELWHLRQRAHQRILAGQVSTPTKAPEVAPEVQATLVVANDADGSLTPRVLSLPLPANPNERSRAVLGKLLDIYAIPGATHPVPGGASSILQVFLLPAPNTGSAESSARADAKSSDSGPVLAVVDLTAAFANNHPSGLQTETLTLLSMCDTLHDNLPHVSEVRFLVDGQPRATLAGHADLTRTYLPAEEAPPIATSAGADQ
jgi:Sporulation and spore germination